MLFISDMLIGELTLLFLLLMVTLRPLFKKKKYLDSFALVAVFAFCLAILQLFVFAANILLLIITALSLFVLLTNIRALQRFASGLYTDQYSTPFRVASYLEGVCIVLCIVLCILFQPEAVDKNIRDKEVYVGSFARGFSKKTEIFQPVNLILTKYGKKNTREVFSVVDSEFELPLVVFLNDGGTSVEDSSIRLSLAAKMGLSIIAGDFYAKDSPKTGTNLDSTFFSSYMMKSFTLHFLPPIDAVAEKGFLKQKELELDELLLIAREKSSSVVIVAEGLAKKVALNAQLKYPDFVVSVFDATEEKALKAYYEKGIADLAFTSPFDALYSSFGGFCGYMGYKNFREFAQNEKYALRFAALLLKHVQDVNKGGS